MLFLLSTTSTTSCTLAFFWGATQSTIWCLATRIITDLLGLQSLAGALGLLTAVRGVACSLGPPAGAWLSHSTGTLGQWLVKYEYYYEYFRDHQQCVLAVWVSGNDGLYIHSYFMDHQKIQIP